MHSPLAAVKTRSVPLVSLVSLEAVLVVLLITAGFALRVWHISASGLDHYDEGVYAFSALGLTDPTQPHRLYPDQIKFSPPVFLFLIGLSYLVSGGPSDMAATAVNVILGTLTIGAVWWIGRRWFGPVAGLAAAALLAFNEYHIALSRSVLTDVAFALFFLLALAAIVSTFQRQSFKWAIVAGLAVGLAWNTKYHGWFALLASGAALVPLLWRQRKQPRVVMRFILLWSTMTGVAVLCYLPWALFIQSQPGGYLELAQYQRTMLDKRWLRNLWVQMRQQFYWEGYFSRLSVLLALLVAWLAGRPFAKNLWSDFRLPLIALVLAGILVGSAGTAALLTLLAVPILLRKPDSFVNWLLLAWLGLWFFSTPLYHPYSRLVLPFTIASFLGAGVWIAQTISPPNGESRSFTQPEIAFAATALLFVTMVALILPGDSNPWRSKRSLAEVAATLAEIVPPGSRVIVIGEPSLAFYLHLNERPAFEHTEDPEVLANLPEPVYLVTGLYGSWVPSVRAGLKELIDRNRMTLLASYSISPGDVRMLDDFTPADVRTFRVSADDRYRLSVYRLFPESNSPR